MLIIKNINLMDDEKLWLKHFCSKHNLSKSEAIEKIIYDFIENDIISQQQEDGMLGARLVKVIHQTHGRARLAFYKPRCPKCREEI